MQSQQKGRHRPKFGHLSFGTAAHHPSSIHDDRWCKLLRVDDHVLEPLLWHVTHADAGYPSTISVHLSKALARGGWDHQLSPQNGRDC